MTSGASGSSASATWQASGYVLFSQLRALAVIVLLVACIVFVALLGGPPASGGVG